MSSSRFMLFPRFLYKQNSNFFFISFFLSFMLFPTIFEEKKLNIEKCPFTYWLNGRWFLHIVDREFEHGARRWFPQIVDRDSGNLYPIYPPFSFHVFFTFYYFGGGGGVLKSAHSLTG